VDSPTKTEPPFVPLRHTGWASHRTPLWVFAAIIALAAGVVFVSLSHKPSQAERASDLTGYFKDVTAGVQSCAGGLRDSQSAYEKVQAGDTADSATATGILTLGAENCSPANNQSLADFTGYQVTESLARFPLDEADNDVITWAFPRAPRRKPHWPRRSRPWTRSGPRSTPSGTTRRNPSAPPPRSPTCPHEATESPAS